MLNFEDQGSAEIPSVVLDGTPVVVCLVTDLFFSARFVDVISAVGAQPAMAERPETFVEAVDRYFPVLALVDLNTSGDWATAIARCKQRPHTRHVPIYAFGSHVEVETLKAARQAGADHAWARSRMMEELPTVVARYVDPPAREVDGCADVLNEEARLGIAAFNRGDYFDQHEHFEQAWLAEERPVREMYQGILQVGVAFLQIERDNWAGALKTFRRGLPRLRGLPPTCQGVDIASFRHAAEAIHLEVTQLGSDRLHEFDRSRFPRIQTTGKEWNEQES